MNLIPWRNRGGLTTRGEHPLEQLRHEFESLFNRMWGGMLTSDEEGWTNQRFWDFDVQENDKEMVVRAEMPGFEEKELDVQLRDNMLTIKAEHQQKEDGQVSYRRYQRSLTLPAGIEADRIQASYRNGVLEMHIPRSEESRPRRIAVQGDQPESEPRKESTPAKK